MASSSTKSAAKANLLGKRKLGDDLETEPILKKHKDKSEDKETTKGLLETNSDHANLISVKETVEELDETPDSVQEASLPKKTLWFGHLSPQANISDIIDFFKDVGEVVRVRLITGDKRITYHRCCGFVEFASANEAKKAMQKKNGEYLLDRRIALDVATRGGATYRPPKFCIDHKVWYKDNLQQESLRIKEDETPPDFVEEVLFVANLSPNTTKIKDIIHFFEDVGDVVSVRLIVNHEGKHVGCGFVEFASSYEAKKALEMKNGEYLHDHKILLMKGLAKTPDSVEAAAVRKKTLLVDNLSCETEISHIIDFFKDVGEVVHVRLVVEKWGEHVGYGFVEFASAIEAKKALQMKNGEYLITPNVI